MTDIAVDTSALVEVMIEGPEASEMRRVLDESSHFFVTPVTRVEAAFVMMGRFGWSRSEFEEGWEALGLREVPVSAAIGTLALDAFETWGKGRGTGAKLNFGDCFSFALAAERRLPLLFVGGDFSRTNIDRA
jgi:ribonuclease VapC